MFVLKEIYRKILPKTKAYICSWYGLRKETTFEEMLDCIINGNRKCGSCYHFEAFKDTYKDELIQLFNMKCIMETSRTLWSPQAGAGRQNQNFLIHKLLAIKTLNICDNVIKRYHRDTDESHDERPRTDDEILKGF